MNIAYKIDKEALQELLNNHGIEAEIILTSDGYCEVKTEDSIYLITESV